MPVLSGTAASLITSIPSPNSKTIVAGRHSRRIPTVPVRKQVRHMPPALTVPPTGTTSKRHSSYTNVHRASHKQRNLLLDATLPALGSGMSRADLPFAMQRLAAFR